MRKVSFLLAVWSIATLLACTSTPKPEPQPSTDPIQEVEYVQKEVHPMKDSVVKLLAFISEEKNSNRFQSWKKYPVKNDTTRTDIVALLKTPHRMYEITKDTWSNSLQIKGDNGSPYPYYIADSGPDGEVESGFWEGYPRGDKREKAYVVGIFAHSDESQICCDHKLYWQIKYQNAIRDIYTQLKL